MDHFLIRKVDVEALDAGIYFITLIGKDSNYSHYFMKE